MKHSADVHFGTMSLNNFADSDALCRRLGIRAPAPALDFGALDVRVGVAA